MLDRAFRRLRILAERSFFIDALGPDRDRAGLCWRERKRPTLQYRIPVCGGAPLVEIQPAGKRGRMCSASSLVTSSAGRRLGDTKQSLITFGLEVGGLRLESRENRPPSSFFACVG
jgi:hypothetical protein